MTERVLGVDPGTLRMGYGLLKAQGTNASYLTYGAISCSRSLPLGQRLWKLYQGLLEILDQWIPHVMAIEEPFVPAISGRDGEYRTSVRSALAVSQAEAVAMMAAAARGIPIFQYTPAQVKSTVTGYGRGSKEQVQEMVRWALGMETKPYPIDASDALAVALCYLHQSHVARLLDTGNR